VAALPDTSLTPPGAIALADIDGDDLDLIGGESSPSRVEKRSAASGRRDRGNRLNAIGGVTGIVSGDFNDDTRPICCSSRPLTAAPRTGANGIFRELDSGVSSSTRWDRTSRRFARRHSTPTMMAISTSCWRPDGARAGASCLHRFAHPAHQQGGPASMTRLQNAGGRFVDITTAARLDGVDRHCNGPGRLRQSTRHRPADRVIRRAPGLLDLQDGTFGDVAAAVGLPDAGVRVARRGDVNRGKLHRLLLWSGRLIRHLGVAMVADVSASVRVCRARGALSPR
jgi:hypothetical protein